MAASLGGSAKITDLGDFVPLIKRNIDQNQMSERAEALELDWKSFSNGDYEKDHPCIGPDYLLVSDCIYYKGKPNFEAINLQLRC